MIRFKYKSFLIPMHLSLSLLIFISLSISLSLDIQLPFSLSLSHLISIFIPPFLFLSLSYPFVIYHPISLSFSHSLSRLFSSTLLYTYVKFLAYNKRKNLNPFGLNAASRAPYIRNLQGDNYFGWYSFLSWLRIKRLWN